MPKLTRTFALLMSVLLLVAGCGSGTAADENDDSGPVVVAVLLTNAGTFAFSSKEVRTAAEVAAESLNKAGGVGGRELKLVFVDNDGTPANTLQAVSRAVQTEGARFVTGWLTSAQAKAVKSRAEQLEVVVLDPISKDSSLIRESCSPNYFRVAAYSDQYTRTIQALVKASSSKSWSLLAPDYAYGRDSSKSFEQGLSTLGRTVGESLFPALGTTDFAPFISQLSKRADDGLIVTSGGADAVNFAKQATSFGLLGKYQMLIGNGLVVPPLLSSMPAKIAGAYEPLSWTPAVKGSEAFTKAFDARSDTAAWYVPADVHASFELLAGAIAKAGTTEPAKVGAALSGLQVDTVLGPVQMRAADHQLQRPMYVSRVVQEGGRLTVRTERTVPVAETTSPADGPC